MKKFFVLIIICLLTGCATVTDGWYKESLNNEIISESIIGNVDLKKTYIHPLFLGFSSVTKRTQLHEKLLQKAKSIYGEDVDIVNVVYESSWSPASLIFYFSLLGYVETAYAKADVYSTTHVSLLKEESQKKKESEALKAIEDERNLEELKDVINQSKQRVVTRKDIKKQDILNQIAKENSPLGIVSYSTTYPNSAGGVGCQIKIYNASNKIIKYVDFTVIPFNRVFDKTYSEIDGQSSKTIQIVNFIEPNTFYTAEWENIWYNHTISFMEIEQIKVTFKDNTVNYISPETIKKIGLMETNKISPLELYANNEVEFYMTAENGRYYFNCKSLEEFENIQYNFQCKSLPSYSTDKISGNMNSYSKLDGFYIYQCDMPNYLAELLYLIQNINLICKKTDGEEINIVISDKQTEIQDFVSEIMMMGLR